MTSSVPEAPAAVAGLPAARSPRRRRVPWIDRVAVAVLLAVVLAALLGPLVVPFSPNEQNLSGVLAPPLRSHHLLGTDALGRDELSRLVYGARISLAISVAAVAIGLAAGVVFGMVAGSRRGWLDGFLMRSMDVLLAFPALVLALVIAAALDPGIGATIVALGVVCIPYFARSARHLTARESERDFIAAARIAGASRLRVLRTHVLPNISGPLVAQATLVIAYMIPAEAALSFLGVGVQPPSASWGNMMADGYQSLAQSAWPMLIPAIAVVVSVASLSLVGDAIGRRTAGRA